MTIEDGSTTTEVIRDFEVDEIAIQSFEGTVAVAGMPRLGDVTAAVGKAAAIAHHLTT